MRVCHIFKISKEYTSDKCTSKVVVTGCLHDGCTKYLYACKARQQAWQPQWRRLPDCAFARQCCQLLV